MVVGSDRNISSPSCAMPTTSNGSVPDGTVPTIASTPFLYVYDTKSGKADPFASVAMTVVCDAHVPSRPEYWTKKSGQA